MVIQNNLPPAYSVQWVQPSEGLNKFNPDGLGFFLALWDSSTLQLRKNVTDFWSATSSEIERSHLANSDFFQNSLKLPFPYLGSLVEWDSFLLQPSDLALWVSNP